jgi:hypothetical protein
MALGPHVKTLRLNKRDRSRPFAVFNITAPPQRIPKAGNDSGVKAGHRVTR